MRTLEVDYEIQKSIMSVTFTKDLHIKKTVIFM